ncbi:phytoene desaturase family protein [Chryseobacterium rhizosphaerae]|uniref:phytoene desaturase family protein n=1 Tax=Chryseobacterium rhizosphaerae TaxID=395937 RepID=UPI003D0DF799
MIDNINVDDLVIGAGLCGLMYGLTAATEGRSVVISEAHHKVGGYATNFYRNKRKFIFDCSQHKVSGLREHVGNLWNTLKRLELHSLLEEFHLHEEIGTVVYRGNFIRIPSEPNEIKETLRMYFPDEASGIEQLFKDIETHGYQHYMFFRRLMNEYTINKDILRESRGLSKITAREYFETLFKGNDIIEVLSPIAIYSGSISNEVNAFYFLHCLYAMFYGGQAYVKGTGQHLSNVLLKEFINRGGILLKKNPVYEMEDDDEHMLVKTRKNMIRAKNVIATCPPEDVLKMLKKQEYTDRFQSVINNFEVGWGHFCVYIVISVPPEEVGIFSPEYLLVSDSGDDFTKEDFENDRYYDLFTLSISNYHRFDPAGGYVIQLVMLDHGDRWFHLSEEEYTARKQKIQDKFIKRALKTFPKLEGKLIYTESSTPKTNYKFTLATKGSAFAYKMLPRTNLSLLSDFPNDKIKLVSTWAGGPGYETAMCFGFTQGKLLSKNTKI